jgi:integration host factor subunit alpha
MHIFACDGLEGVMTKADLAEKVMERLRFQRKDSLELVETFLDILKDTLARGEDVKISGFGNFQVRKKADRKGRNPVSGEAMMISSRKVLTFKTSPVFKGHLNS